MNPDAGIMSWEQADQIMQEQRAEIARLREAIRRLADQDATLSVCDGNVTVTMDVTLTDEERVDVAMWLSECLRQCSLATDGGSEEVAERWRHRSERAARMLERLG